MATELFVDEPSVRPSTPGRAPSKRTEGSLGTRVPTRIGAWDLGAGAPFDGDTWEARDALGRPGWLVRLTHPTDEAVRA